MRIGIDVGGTHTDAVLMDGTTVLASVKTATTLDVTGGIVAALERLLTESGVDRSAVHGVMIGTTHFTNALVTGRGLARTAVVRLALPATAALPPMVDWPERLVGALRPSIHLCHGGHEFDGRPIAPLRPDELKRVAGELAAQEIGTVAISSVFSPVNAELEEAAAEILLAELPCLHISLSHQIGRIGLLERENATIVNACLRDLADDIVAAFTDALRLVGVTAPLYLSQNDGTLMDAEFTRRYPIRTFASGPTNSMRGAAFLADHLDCAVVDIGGTTTDVGVLTGGYPRQAGGEVEFGGVRVNFRMPDVLSFGLGGGSRVTRDPVEVGPDSVGYRLTSEALVFGGQVLTASDLAVAAGLADFGDVSLVRHLDRDLVGRGIEWMVQKVAELVDRMRISAAPLPVVLVGGGSVLIPPELPGVSAVHRPKHHGVANAIGAAIGQIGGDVDRLWTITASRTREAVLEEARAEAIERATAAGAAPGTVEVKEVDEVHVAYLPGNAVRVRVKAVGELDLAGRRDGEDDQWA
ncbi:N-methylhydantoinase A/oxoprolinase/acetone carboxylase, beta subunit [Nonomuraea solani]|uniref:N-methylhydantoinase A/oxoprolinase/acetone carboxylase, beta subunit n=1 Tax=Nonomuraea solani TaxID=1144553 RepID=A0A1H6BYM6_9ACTN|nr:hydantoinase/oxoprolinase family protein [Nonomuraea solani]SEG65535.1 N-methylhydantoinase A/oxoprolinase/acetone carboxylase, beta subunit [Nonomuraea solani]